MLQNRNLLRLPRLGQLLLLLGWMLQTQSLLLQLGLGQPVLGWLQTQILQLPLLGRPLGWLQTQILQPLLGRPLGLPG